MIYGKIKNKRGGLSKEMREDIFKKFGNECVLCGAGEGLHVHHRDNNLKNNSPDNLILLCGVCHKKTHMKVR